MIGQRANHRRHLVRRLGIGGGPPGGFVHETQEDFALTALRSQTLDALRRRKREQRVEQAKGLCAVRVHDNVRSRKTIGCCGSSMHRSYRPASTSSSNSP